MTSAQPDPAVLLAAIADALNQCERAGVVIDSPASAVMTSHGYVLPSGDARPGSRWQARPRLRHSQTQPEGRYEED